MKVTVICRMNHLDDAGDSLPSNVYFNTSLRETVDHIERREGSICARV